MDRLTAAASSRRHTEYTSRFILTIALLFALGVLVVLGALINISDRLNTEELHKNQFYAERALENRMATSSSYATSYAVWTTGYQRLNGEVDRHWAYDEHNVGQSLFTSNGYEGVFVINRATTKYAMVKGRLVDDQAAQWLSTELTTLVDQVHQQPPRSAPLSIYALFDGWPAVVTASAILPNDDGPSVDPRSTSVLLFVDQLTPAKLRSLGQRYNLAELTSVSDTLLQPEQPRLALDSTGFSLTWTPARPGSELLWSLLPPLGGVVLILGLLLIYFFRYALQAARNVDASYQALELSSQALKASEERFRAVAEAASDWIWETDEQSRITYLSMRFAAVTGFDNAQWLGQDIEQLLDCETTSLTLWLHSLNNGQNLSNLRCRYRDQSGQLRYCRVSARPILEGQTVVGFRGTASDITDEVAAHAQIQHLSMHDALTGLPNRNKLSRYLEEALAAKDEAPALALILVDLDNFKPINDSLGHPVGDAVLLEVASRLRESTREHDLVARLGGDEFVVVLCGMDSRSGIDRFCTRLIDSLKRPILHEDQSLYVGASMGIAQSRLQGYQASELIRCADIALYQAKADGKNTWRYFAAQMSEQIQHRRQLENELRLAVKNEDFVLHFQPRYRVDSQQIVSVEALVRWQHPVEGLLGPDTFIPLAEQTDLIVPLGRWVLREACQTAAQWPEPLLVSVNLSPAQFSRSDVVKDVRDILIQTQFPAARLELEITETVMLNDIDGALATMNALKELGVRLNMDDFGTGYSSLGYLRTYPFDGIKIDKRFIASMSNGSNDRAVVQAIINLGKAMGLTVTAEGVETEQQLQSLSSDQCHEVQGYFLSRPIDKQAFQRLLRAQLPDPRGPYPSLPAEAKAG